ncbi:hypothetical protein GV828_07800 [Flavobacterium sp. NST-5]|uniref:Uncharacterized protein n=1 Tax=Flavobacterium ichthyis TaxID=2698827 RepID=A0ABW9Z903_9FLAO|nr:hypothetical protein [Flavobacterium ichthyis]NBL65099.1 hypothetical protein [Flavobacterium ichthyis]
MKKLFLGIFASLLFSISGFAQKDCEYPVNFTDSIGTYKETKQVIVHEKNFANASTFIFFSLAVSNDTPLLNFQLFQKSKDFVTAHCLDKNSKIYLQLLDGSIITLLNSNSDDNCGNSVRDEQGNNIRITTGMFLFLKNSLAKLEQSPVTLIRVKYATETIDYIIKSELKSELNGTVYKPEKFFIENLKCVTSSN